MNCKRDGRPGLVLARLVGGLAMFIERSGAVTGRRWGPERRPLSLRAAVRTADMRLTAEVWPALFSQARAKGILLPNDIPETFEDVVNHSIDADMGFGYVTASNDKPDAKVVLQGSNPFVDNKTVSKTI